MFSPRSHFATVPAGILQPTPGGGEADMTQICPGHLTARAEANEIIHARLGFCQRLFGASYGVFKLHEFPTQISQIRW